MKLWRCSSSLSTRSAGPPAWTPGSLQGCNGSRVACGLARRELACSHWGESTDLESGVQRKEGDRMKWGGHLEAGAFLQVIKSTQHILLDF